ncbi:phage minor tail protein L, partial [Escherichia coli]
MLAPTYFKDETMGIKADIQSLSPSALIELFVLDMSSTTSLDKLFLPAVP